MKLEVGVNLGHLTVLIRGYFHHWPLPRMQSALGGPCLQPQTQGSPSPHVSSLPASLQSPVISVHSLTDVSP